MSSVKITEKESITIRFAGDSGDGMQLTGDQFTNTSAIMGNDISTFPDYPAEIRAPAGTLPGVSGFQLHFSSNDIRTPGNMMDVLVVMNPAALQVNIKKLKKNGLIIANQDAFTKGNLKKIDLETSPLDDQTLIDFNVIKLPFSQLVSDVLKDDGLTRAEMERCKNFYALGVVYWLHNRSIEPTLNWIKSKFASKPLYVKANSKALEAGFTYADVSELFSVQYHIPKAKVEPGVYRKITGNEGVAFGLIAASNLCGVPLFYGTYPITPASDILHYLSLYKNYDIRTFQAEDEIAAIGTAIGASYGGHIGVTGTSGPGLCLKSEALGLAVITELPLVVINVQRGGPSTGLPTKTEQSDLLQTFYGRNGDSPVAIFAPSCPSDCFEITLEAVKIALKYMTPVVILTDGYIANSSEPWKLPEMDSLEEFEVKFATSSDFPDGVFKPYERNPETYARPWAVPGTPDLEHRIGGLEKEDVTGNVSYDGDNHQKMTELRMEKIEKIVADVPNQEIFGDKTGKILVLGWGGTYGAITSAVEEARAEGVSVSSAHLKYINPLPKNLGDVMDGFDKVLVPELNTGQLSVILNDKFQGVEFHKLNKIQGLPFFISEIIEKIKELI